MHILTQSEGVASAVYEMDWYAADPRFKKMLSIIAVRAQQPVFLKATVFLNISMATMTMVSYQNPSNFYLMFQCFSVSANEL